MARFRVQLSTVGGGLISDVPGPAKPTQVTELAQWQSAEHGAGGLDGFRRTLVPLFLWTIDLPNLKAPDFALLEEFFAEVNGNADLWLYTHTDDLEYEVRFWDQPQYKRENSRMYTATLLLLCHQKPQGVSP